MSHLGAVLSLAARIHLVYNTLLNNALTTIWLFKYYFFVTSFLY